MIKYLDTAEQIMRMRRDNLVLGKSTHEDHQLEQPRAARACAWSGLIFLVSTCVTLYNVLLNNEVKESNVVKGCLTMWISGVICLGCASDMGKEETKMRHSNAISIKELLYDYAEYLVI